MTKLSPILLGHRPVFSDSSPKEQEYFFVEKVHSGFEGLYLVLRSLLCLILIVYIRIVFKEMKTSKN